MPIFGGYRVSPTVLLAFGETNSCLREIQTRRRGFLRSKDGDVGIGCNLKHRKAEADNEQAR